MWDVQLALALHLLAAAVFVGCNVLLERVVHRLDAIPPREAARMGELIGTDIVFINFGALLTAFGSGLYMMWYNGMLGDALSAGFYADSYGRTLGLMMALWASLIVTSSIITFYLRPRLLVKLPFDTGRDALEPIGARAMAANEWMSRLGRYNLAAGIGAVLSGALLHYGGL